uniref:Transmembrane protein 25 n=1 Tax=Stegastes partitus TaxID=144197 RepID=A0A3B5AQK5_9TELE
FTEPPGLSHLCIDYNLVATGAIEPAPKIDGWHRAALTLQENMTHKFNCQSDGWDPRAPPLLTWYLNGEPQREPSPHHGRLVMTSKEDSEVMRPGTNHNSTFSLRARKWDRELVCVASNPRTGESYNASVTLNVQFQPEILRVNAQYSETSDPGLSLVLFALVRSNPPATITFVDQSGQLVANTSDFLILDSRSYPWLTNHSLRVTLSSLSGNISLNVSNSVGTVQNNLTLADSREIYVSDNLQFRKYTYSLSSNLKTEKVDKTHIPRENMSLPSNMQLHDLSTLRKAREAAQQNSRLLFSSPLWFPGFARYPMVGYIYKVNSTSSEEIWL